MPISTNFCADVRSGSSSSSRAFPAFFGLAKVRTPIIVHVVPVITFLPLPGDFEGNGVWISYIAVVFSVDTAVEGAYRGASNISKGWDTSEEGLNQANVAASVSR